VKLRRKRKDIRASIDAAIRARDNANGRLAEARDIIAAQKERARGERATIITALARMRQQNNLARMILDTVERGTGGADEASGHADE
jgi:hypothetical protein